MHCLNWKERGIANKSKVFFLLMDLELHNLHFLDGEYQIFLPKGCTMGRGCVSSNTPKRIPSCSNPTSPNLIMNRDASKDREKRDISHLNKLVSLCVSNSAKDKVMPSERERETYGT